MIITTIDTFGMPHPDWKARLGEVLDHAGYEKEFDIVNADASTYSAIASWDGKSDLMGHLAEHAPDTLALRLFVPGATGDLVNYCIEQAGHALYGCCLSESWMAVEYAPDDHRLSTQLHESLHLFGVYECYDPDSKLPIDSCDNENCVMRYGLNSTEVCSHVLRQIKCDA